MNKNLTIYAAAVATLAQYTQAAIVEDGIWTDNDWYNATLDIGVTNGIAYSNDEEVQRRITAPHTIDGSIEENYRNETNVQRVQYVFPENQWADAFPQADDIYTYDNLLRAVAKFPSFCAETNIEDQTVDETCKRELAAIFAHWTEESGKRAQEEGELWTQGLYYVQDMRCNDNDEWSCQYRQSGWQNDAWPNQPEKQYYGRGPFQLKWNYNYGRFSNVFAPGSYNSKLYLLENPELIQEDGYVALAAGIWFYMTPHDTKPSMHNVMTGFFQPNDIDINAGLTATFGTTTNIVNGNVECSQSTETQQATSRGEYYLKWLDFFGMPAEEGLGCADQMNYFPYAGSSDVAGYWAEEWSGATACRPTTYWTQYEISSPDDYKRCVCDTQGEGEADCPDNNDESESEDAEDESEESEESVEEEEDESVDNDSEIVPFLFNRQEQLQVEASSDTITQFQELVEIYDTPNYEDGSTSRTLYQAERELEFIEGKLLEMYIAMQENGLLQ